MPTDTEKKLNGTPEPFRRRVVWGRPPATVFRAGPLPGSPGPSPLPGPAPMQRTPGVLTGSLIPRAAPTPPLPPVAAGPDLTVRPLPAVEPEAARRPEPVPAPAPAQPVASAARTITSPAPSVRAALKPASRMPLYAAIALAALTVIALGGWIWMRPPAGTPAPTEAERPSTDPETLIATRPQPIG